LHRDPPRMGSACLMIDADNVAESRHVVKHYRPR
jgi:hypothetical protein